MSDRTVSPASPRCSYLVTWVTSVAALPLYGGSAFDPGAALAGRGSVLLGALEVVLAVAVVGTSLALYPSFAVTGTAPRSGMSPCAPWKPPSSLPVSSRSSWPSPAPRQRPARASSRVVAQAAAAHDWTFSFVGPGLINPVNAVVLAVLLFRRRLVAPFIPCSASSGLRSS